MGLRLNMAFGFYAGRKVGGLVRFEDHDVAIHCLHLVGPHRQFGRWLVQAPVRRSILVGAGVVDGEDLAAFCVEDSDGRRCVEP